MNVYTYIYIYVYIYLYMYELYNRIKKTAKDNLAALTAVQLEADALCHPAALLSVRAYCLCKYTV